MHPINGEGALMGDSANAQPEAEDRAHARQLGFTGGRFLARKPVVFS